MVAPMLAGRVFRNGLQDDSTPTEDVDQVAAERRIRSILEVDPGNVQYAPDRSTHQWVIDMQNGVGSAGKLASYMDSAVTAGAFQAPANEHQALPFHLSLLLALCWAAFLPTPTPSRPLPPFALQPRSLEAYCTTRAQTVQS